VCGLVFGLFDVSGVILNSSAFIKCDKDAVVVKEVKELKDAVERDLTDYKDVTCIAGGAFGWVFSAKKGPLTVALKVYHGENGLSLEKKRLLQHFYTCMYHDKDPGAKLRRDCNKDNQVKFSLPLDEVGSSNKILVNGKNRMVEQWAHFTEKSLDDTNNKITDPGRFLKMMFLWMRGILLMRSCGVYHNDMQFSNVAYGNVSPTKFVIFDWDRVKHISQFTPSADSDMWAISDSTGANKYTKLHKVGPSAQALSDFSLEQGNWMKTADWAKWTTYFSVLHRAYGVPGTTFCDAMGAPQCTKNFIASQTACGKVPKMQQYTDPDILASGAFGKLLKSEVKAFLRNNEEATDDTNVYEPEYTDEQNKIVFQEPLKHSATVSMMQTEFAGV